MGNGIASSCPADLGTAASFENDAGTWNDDENLSGWYKEQYDALGLLHAACQESDTCKHLDDEDPAGHFLPLVLQKSNQTHILEQPLDFTTLADKYNEFAMGFLEEHKNSPFFLYMPFSHVHTTSKSQPEMQYAGCAHKGSTRRGPFGDALAEADWIVGNIVQKLEELALDKDTLILFTSDNGPWLLRSLSGGSEGLFTGRYSGYWDTGKGSNWEGGIREPAFAYWAGTIQPFSRSTEVISSMDVFPTLSKLAGVDLPKDRAFDGRDASEILLKEGGKSQHDYLFFYGTCNGGPYHTVTAVRHGKYKAHWCTAPGLAQWHMNLTKHYDPPLMFNIEKDPSETLPLNAPNEPPHNKEDSEALNRILRAHAMELATFEFGNIIPIPDGPDEGPGHYGLCCDRSRGCNCTDQTPANVGIFNLGTKTHHDKYHYILGEEAPSPPRTGTQRKLQEVES